MDDLNPHKKIGPPLEHKEGWVWYGFPPNQIRIPIEKLGEYCQFGKRAKNDDEAGDE